MSRRPDLPADGYEPVRTLGNQFAGAHAEPRQAGRRGGVRRLLHQTKTAFASADVLDMYRAGVPDAVELVEALRDVLEDADGGRRPAADGLAFLVNTGTPAQGGWLVVFRVAAPFPAVVRMTKALADDGTPAGGWDYHVERTSGRTTRSRALPPEPGPPAPYPGPEPGLTRFLDL